jgi:hypothetical protein
MSIPAKLAYLTSPAPDRYILNVQTEGDNTLVKYEISEAHLANIICDGASFALRKNRRVIVVEKQDGANVGAGT